LSGRILNYSEMARALGVSQPTAKDYFDIAHGTFLWRAIPAWTRDNVKRTVKHPRGYLRDTGLLHALLRLPDADALLRAYSEGLRTPIPNDGGQRFQTMVDGVSDAMVDTFSASLEWVSAIDWNRCPPCRNVQSVMS
jgi:hypothetical protein